jgi:hypothetical protein
MATGVIQKERGIHTNVTCGYVNENMMRAYNVDVPTGYDLKNGIMNMAYNATSIKVKNIQISSSDIIVRGDNFSQDDSLVLYVTWLR